MTLERIEALYPRADRGAPRPSRDRVPARRLRARRRARDRRRRASTSSRRARSIGADPLAPFGPNAARPRAPHPPLRALPRPRRQQHATGTAPTEVAAFEELVGSHGGMGGSQSFPFMLAPADLDWPDGRGHRRRDRPPGLPAAGSRGSARTPTRTSRRARRRATRRGRAAPPRPRAPAPRADRRSAGPARRGAPALAHADPLVGAPVDRDRQPWRDHRRRLGPPRRVEVAGPELRPPAGDREQRDVDLTPTSTMLVEDQPVSPAK